MKHILKKYLSDKKKKTQSNFSEFEKEALHAFASKIEKVQRRTYRSFELLLWDLYPQFVKMSMAAHNRIKPDAEYVENGFKQGLITKEPIDYFTSLLKSAETYPISHDDYDRDYVTHPDLIPHEKVLNASHKLFVLDKTLLAAMNPIIQELRDPVAACIGAPWRIINVLCWETFPYAAEEGPNAWHTDGLPFAVNKVMIYLNGASHEQGTTSLKFEDGSTKCVEGPPGTWMLFKISEILHKGEKPQKGSRLVLEIRVIPSFEFDLRPYSAGFNAHYPKHPWHALPH